MWSGFIPCSQLTHISPEMVHAKLLINVLSQNRAWWSALQQSSSLCISHGSLYASVTTVIIFFTSLLFHLSVKEKCAVQEHLSGCTLDSTKPTSVQDLSNSPQKHIVPHYNHCTHIINIIKADFYNISVKVHK